MGAAHQDFDGSPRSENPYPAHPTLPKFQKNYFTIKEPL
jgi:hypothetical protein